MEHHPPTRWRSVALGLRRQRPLADWVELRESMAQIAVIGVFLILSIALLSYARAVLLPVTLALVIGTILIPIVSLATRVRVPASLSAVVLVLLLFAALSYLIVILSDPVRDWIGRAPELGAVLKERLQFLNRPIAALNNLRDTIGGPSAKGPDEGAIRIDVVSGLIQPAVALLTPAAGQLLIFFGTLFFFLAGRERLRQQFVSFSGRREARLRALRIISDFEANLARYFVTVTAINAVLGLFIGFATYLIGLPNPIVWGILAFLLNYVPYLGAAVAIAMLFGVGLVYFDTLGQALLAPLVYLGLSSFEGQFLTPAIVGRRLTMSPLLVFLSVAFWAWLWGPFGALLAVPILIGITVAISHSFPKETVDLPG